VPLLKDFMQDMDTDVIGRGLGGGAGVDNQELIAVNAAIRNHPVEIVGRTLRGHMTAMKRIV
jgi:ketol-acid reductoisomerase